MTEKATDKQRELMAKLGIPDTGLYSKEIAAKLISETIEAKKAEGNNGKPEKSSGNGSKREFHLTPEQVRTNAMDFALRRYPQLDTPDLIREAEKFVRFLNGR